MTWLIRKQGWEGMTNLCDTRSDASYPYHELDGAKFVKSNDEGEVCFQLVDGRIAWLVSTDLEVEYPLQNDTIVEKSVIPTHNHTNDHMCDRCGTEVPNGSGHYPNGDTGDRVCRECSYTIVETLS